MPILEVQNIRKRFGKTEVLKGIDFSMEQGQVLSVIGSSGSGKTTLLRCINQLEQADEGRIIVDGKTVFDAVQTPRLTGAEKKGAAAHLRAGISEFQSFPPIQRSR